MATFWIRHSPSIWHTLTHFLVTCSKRKSLRITEHLSGVSFYYVCSDHCFCIKFMDSLVLFCINSHIFSFAFNLIPAPLCCPDLPPLMLLYFPQFQSISYLISLYLSNMFYSSNPISLPMLYLSFPISMWYTLPFYPPWTFHPSLLLKPHLFSKAFLNISMHTDCIFLCVCLPYKLWPLFIVPIKYQAHFLYSLQLHKVIVVILIL